MSAATQTPVQPSVPQKTPHRGFLTLSVMVTTIMQTLDTTIANVALPHMQGTMGATQDQIAWVLTSYIVASAICMPLTGFLTARFGRKRIFLLAVIGFTLTSMLCGMAQNLTQMVLFRLLQGVFGASLVPLSQSILLDAYPVEKHGMAMAIWGMGIMVGPILGPTLGGWLTEYYNWRWVFYINIPFGLLAWLGLNTFLQESPLDKTRRLDWAGFIFFSVAIGAFQMLLDKGESLNWFASLQIQLLGFISALSTYLFFAHIFTHDNPYINPNMFRDRNFTVAVVSIFTVGIILLSATTLLPPFMHNLMNFPVVDVGLLLAPRGVGTMFAMVLVGKLAGKIDIRLTIYFGLFLTIYSLWMMSQFTTDMTAWDVVIANVIQGFGLAFVFVPLTTVAFSTLAPHFRNEGTSLFSLMRNIGSSIGISIVISKLGQNAQANHAALSEFINPSSTALQYAQEAGIYSTHSTQGLMALNAEVSRQAITLAYLQDFRLMMWVVLVTFPLVFLLKPAVK